MSKISKRLSLKPLVVKSKFIQQLEFSENVEDIYGKCRWRARSCSPTTISIHIFLNKKTNSSDKHIELAVSLRLDVSYVTLHRNQQIFRNGFH